MQIYSFSPFGYEGALVAVEVDLRRGIPAVDIVGLADSAVKESRERMQAAIRNSGFEFPSERVLISLSPADLKKEGAGFDLPIALSVLSAGSPAAAGNSAGSPAVGSGDASVLVMGELELSGRIRPVRGVHAAASTAAACGITRCIVPSANAEEAREAPGMETFGADTLEDAYAALSRPDSFTGGGGTGSGGRSFIPDDCEEIDGVLFPPAAGYEFAEIAGQTALVRALQIAAAGRHNLIAVGAPGCGKTMALQKFPGLLPLLTAEEAHPVTRIFSIAGLLPPDEPLMRVPPFRMPHQTATIEGMCGGGPYCRPGEISLAHNGVLFLDEAAEFRSSVLQMLRVPLESGRVTLCRAGRSTVFPADFQLLMAANPCPCGNFGSKTKVCLCGTRSIELYWKKFSAPLLDRIELRVAVENTLAAGEDDSGAGRISTEALRRGIARAVAVQRNRQGKRNAALSPQETAEFCRPDSDAKRVLDQAVRRHGFSPRAAAGCLKIARTAADIDGRETICAADMAEAVKLRRPFNNFMEIE